MSLKNRIVLTASIMAIIIASAGFISGLLKVDNAQQRYNELAINAHQQLWDLITLNQFALMSPNIKLITRDRKLKKAIAKGDQAVINDNAGTAYNLLFGQELISSMQLMDKNGKILFDASDSSQVSRINELSLKAIDQKQNITSLTLDAKGRLQTELAFPITQRGKVIGAGAFTLTLDNAIAALKQRQNSQIYIADNNHQLQSFSNVDLSHELETLELPFSQGNHLILEHGENIFSVTILPLKNFKQDLLGNIIMISDNTQSFQSQQNINITAISLLVIISIISVAFIFWFLGQSLNPLHSISQSLKAVSEGDLTVAIEQSKRNDEIAEIQQAIGNTIQKLHALISQVTPVVSEVNDSSEVLTQAMQSNQDNITRQQQNIEQLQNATLGVETAIGNISQYSEQVSQRSQETDEELEKGSQIIHQTINAIKKIAVQVENSSTVINKLSSDTDSIAGILDVIKGIAEQTNLLALNAAIEAARAGEQGRGFAVVADEVRSLAGKTQESTLEIEQTIEQLRASAVSAVSEMNNSQKEVENCVALANKTEESLAIITPKMAEIKHNNIEINHSITEQRNAIEGINQNISTISQLSENNVEKNSEAVTISKNLKQFSDRLDSLVEQFKV